MPHGRLPFRTAIVTAFIAATSVFGPANAAPIDPTSQDERSDRTEDRDEALNDAAAFKRQHEPTVPPSPAFEVRIDAPLYYDTNAQELERGASAALEGNPEATLGWKHPIASLPFTIGVQLAANTDRYANVAQADGDEATATVRLQYYDRNDDQALAPFVWYQGALMFDATFSPWTETEQDVAIGLEKSFNFAGGLHALPRSARSADHALWSVDTELSVQRRLRTPGPDSTALVAKLSVNRIPAAAWTVSVTAEAKRRWYDAFMLANGPAARRDYLIEPIVTLLWDSGVASFGSPQLALQVAFERQFSNAPGRSYSGWAVGPILTVAWRF